MFVWMMRRLLRPFGGSGGIVVPPRIVTGTFGPAIPCVSAVFGPATPCVAGTFGPAQPF